MSKVWLYGNNAELIVSQQSQRIVIIGGVFT